MGQATSHVGGSPDADRTGLPCSGPPRSRRRASCVVPDGLVKRSDPMPEAQFPAIHVPGNGKLYARFHTSPGALVIELEELRAPNTVKNFVGLATGAQEWKHPKTGETHNGKP